MNTTCQGRAANTKGVRSHICLLSALLELDGHTCRHRPDVTSFQVHDRNAGAFFPNSSLFSLQVLMAGQGFDPAEFSWDERDPSFFTKLAGTNWTGRETRASD